MLLSDSLRIVLVLLVFGAMTIQGDESPSELQDLEEMDIDRLDQELADEKISPEEMEMLSRKVGAMSDDQLAGVLYAVMPHERTRRTIGTARRCLEKVRCLFGALKRSSRTKRNSSPAAILRAISKLTSIASDAANELLGKRFGDTLSLSNLFKVPATSSSSAISDSLNDDFDSESASSSISASALADDDESSNLAEAGSDVVEKKTCDQRCNLSIMVFRRLRRLLKNI